MRFEVHLRPIIMPLLNDATARNGQWEVDLWACDERTGVSIVLVEEVAKDRQTAEIRASEWMKAAKSGAYLISE